MSSGLWTPPHAAMRLVLKLSGACGSFSACYDESLLILSGYLVFVHSLSFFFEHHSEHHPVRLLVWILSKAFSCPRIGFQAC